MNMMYIITNNKLNEQAILIACTEEGAFTAVKFVRPDWDNRDLTAHAVLPGTVVFRKI